MKDVMSEAFEKIFPALPEEQQSSMLNIFEFMRQAAERARKKRTFWEKITDALYITDMPLLEEDRLVIRKLFAIKIGDHETQ